MKRWYYNTSIDSFDEFLEIDDDDGYDIDLDAKGPFDTFTEAKLDAIQYHQTTIYYSRQCIEEIKKIRKKDL